MTTVQTMLSRWIVRVIALAMVLPLVSCETGPAPRRLIPPTVTTAPYSTAGGDLLFAVVPLRNESGVGSVDTMRVGDAVVGAVAQVNGLRCLPLNRTIEAMRSEGLSAVTTPEEARLLADALGVDGLLLGSVTAYDPYNPPTLGLSLALLGRTQAVSVPASGVDTRRLRYQPTEWNYFPDSRFSEGPASAISEHLDSRRHDIQMAIRSYATGRDDERYPLGWERYMLSMDLYTSFAAAYSVARLLDAEASRLAQAERQMSGR